MTDDENTASAVSLASQSGGTFHPQAHEAMRDARNYFPKPLNVLEMTSLSVAATQGLENHHLKWRLSMTNRQDTNSKAEAESLDSRKDAAQNKASQISTSEKDALSDSSLDDVSGGRVPPTHKI
ncbi:hypothetical protein [Bradyrhizobium sp. CCBAU 11386]|uniref:hypothetical protein n=1 Tax=Bradyrhizobium sp. CCBAU 11386 TaxID=1630837 RepID=UPI002302EB34|nr:hypothetical protein [Bradyrhizobium sp. CCBAU 11386]